MYQRRKISEKILAWHFDTHQDGFSPSSRGVALPDEQDIEEASEGRKESSMSDTRIKSRK
jgi:hypothetical protein